MFTPSAGKTARSSTSDEDANPSPHKKQKLGESKEQDPTDAAASGEIDLPTRTIEGTVQHHYEVTEILPRLHVLRDLLTKRLYNEEAEEETTTAGEEQHQQEEESKETDDVDMTKDPASSPSAASCTAKSTPLYTFSSLRRLVQASDVELQRGLADLDAFEDSRGYWRILDPDYTAKVFDSLVTLFVEKQWTSVERIDVRECEEGLQELYPKVVTRQVLRMHSTPATPAGGGAVDPNMVSLSAQKVALLQALQLFARLQPYPHVQFLADWQARMPEGMKVDVTWLRGHALCDVSAQLEAFSRAASVVTGAVKPSEESLLTWRYFPVSSLSPLSKTRFAQLFDARAKWRLGEIEPYVAGLCTPGQTIEQLLLKMTRPISVVENGSKVVVYTRKN
jgi:hypothetical protein